MELEGNIGFCAYYTLCIGKGDTTEENGMHIHYTCINDRVYNRYEGEVLTDFVSRGIERMNVGGE